MLKPQPATHQVKPLIPSTEIWSFANTLTLLQQYLEWFRIYLFQRVSQLAKQYMHAKRRMFRPVFIHEC